MKSFSRIVCMVLFLTPNIALPCSKLLNDLVYRAVKPVIEGAGLCHGLKKGAIGVDKTARVELSGFEYCTGENTSSLKANLSVTCKTSKKAFIKASLSEKVKVKAIIHNDSCKVIDFKMAPTGEISKAIANNSSFKEDAKKAFQKNINTLCGT